MLRSAELAPLVDALLAAAERATSAGRTPVVLIDGPSGAGKSSLADLLLGEWPAPGTPRLVRMDDLYPGWDGLDAGSLAVGRDLLEPLRATGEGTWERWDWVAGRPADRERVAGGEPLVVEGCGTLSRRNAAAADLTVWLRAEDALRKRRALARDGDTFAAQWDRWQTQFDRYLEREHPLRRADVVLDITRLDLTRPGCDPVPPDGLTEPRSGTTVET